jgi:type VI secretion system protein ImpK
MAPSDIDDPFAPRDATIVRPRAGGPRRPPAEAGAPGAPGTPGGAGRPPSASYARSDSGPVPLPDMHGVGLNPLVQAASPLLLMAGQFRYTPMLTDVPGLRRQVLDEIRRFEDRARSAGVKPEVVLGARYALSATLDEAVLATPWGAQSEWAQQTLLVALHREAWGGQKFFDMLERVSSDPARHIELMELQYLCLAVGFGGKYRVAEQGEAQLADVQQALYRKIRDYRGAPEPTLSVRWMGRQDRRNPLIRYVPWWVFGAATVAVLALTFVVLYTRIGGRAAVVHAALAQIGVEAFSTASAPARAAGPTLKQLLAGEETRRTLNAEEEGGRTTVTLLVPDLFASGSAAVNPQARDVLSRIGDFLRQVPGRVLVVGHTDDQAIRSLRFQNNVSLSQARAESVAALLRQRVDVAARVQSNGVGSTQPRYRPESDPQNRAKNRRVEIVHVSES